MEKFALVTGASSDIGISIVNNFLKNDINVIGHYNNYLPSLKNKKLHWIKSNFNDPQKIDIFLSEVFNQSPYIHYLVNAVGLIENIPFNDVKYEDIINIYNTNVFFHFLLMQKIFLNMESQNFGRIVSLSSIGVKYAGSPTSIIYSSSKSALEALTRSFAKLGAEKNILCNNIRVGIIDTKIHSKNNMEDRINLIPLKRLGNIEDISNLVMFLCLPTGDFITSQDISVSGGE